MVKEGKELKDEKAKEVLKARYSFTTNGLVSIFLHALSAMLGMIALFALASAAQGWHVASNAFGAILFGTAAGFSLVGARKQWRKQKMALSDVRNDLFFWREAVILEKHESFSKNKNGERKYFGVLYFPNEDDPSGKERVEVSMKLYENVIVGDSAYLIYLKNERIPMVIPKNEFYDR